MAGKWAKRLLSLILASAYLTFGAAGASAADNSAEQQAERQRRIMQAFDDYAGVLGLTQQQRVEDYEAMWEILETSYPFLGVLEREGVDLEELKTHYRDMLDENPSDFALYSAVNSVLYRMGGVGHIMFFDSSTFENFRDTYAFIGTTADEELNRRLKPWYAVLNDPAVAANYQKLAVAERALDGDGGGNGWNNVTGSAPENLEYEWLPGNILYIKIHQFINDYQEDKERLFALYGQAEEAGCRDIIIDISENGGGDTRYWNDAIVAPNISETRSVSGTLVFQKSAQNLPYLSATYPEDYMHPISELPELPRFPKEDRARLTHFVSESMAYEPLEPGQKMFSGNFWVLTGPRVYSASEAFAIFCKQTGFATLVGSPTGGDGFGVDPVYGVLPNSRITFRYSMTVALNPDGGNNEEYGTAPDIGKKTGETPLEACLRAIGARRLEPKSTR